MPVYRIPFNVISLPAGDFFDPDDRVERPRPSRRNGETRRVRPLLRAAAGSVR